MNERLQELYRQAIQSTNSDEYLDMPNKQVQRLILTKYAELVRQEERESCAVLVDNADTPDGWSAASLANAIRARGVE